MAGVVEVVSGLDATISLFGVVCKLVDTILQAREDVSNATVKTNKLLQTVVKAQSCLFHLENKLEGRKIWDGLHSQLQNLAAELCLALEKVQKNRISNERREAGSKILAMACSAIGKGASQQNRDTFSIIQRLEKVLVDLDSAVLYFIAGEVASITALPRSLPPPRSEHELVKRMLTLASAVNETLRVVVAVSQSNSNSWYDPSSSKKHTALKKPVGIRIHSMRHAIEGGYEVPNFTKARFSMSVTFDRWYFYVLTYDKWENAEPEVFFPKSVNNEDNWVCSESKRSRIFPNHNLHGQDPLSLKVTRSAHLPDTDEGQVSIFLVLSTKQLQTDGSLHITIQDIERYMDSAEDELVVKHIPFDIQK